MNANVLHRWLKESSQSRPPISSGADITAVDITAHYVHNIYPSSVLKVAPHECALAPG
jgi:hypothetical protein